MNKKQIQKKLREKYLPDIDWATFRLPKKIAKYRLAFPRVTPAIIKLFKKLMDDGYLLDNILPYKTVARLYNEVKEYGLPKNMVLKKHPKIGYGVFTQDKAIKPKTILGIYTGKYLVSRVGIAESSHSLYIYGVEENIALDEKEYANLKKDGFLYQPKKKFDDDDAFEITLDAQPEGNWTRFINHSDKPNCSVELRRIQVSEKGFAVVPVITTKRKIMPHTQVTTNYGKEYWEEIKIKKKDIKESEFIDLF